MRAGYIIKSLESNGYEVEAIHNRQDTPDCVANSTVVMIGLNDKLLGRGYSICNPKENFNKNTGLKIALARAMKEGIPSKRERTSIYEDAKQEAELIESVSLKVRVIK